MTLQDQLCFRIYCRFVCLTTFKEILLKSFFQILVFYNFSDNGRIHFTSVQLGLAHGPCLHSDGYRLYFSSHVISSALFEIKKKNNRHYKKCQTRNSFCCWIEWCWLCSRQITWLVYRAVITDVSAICMEDIRAFVAFRTFSIA